MSDPVSNAEIEDVLSSIRRLVSEDPSPLHKRKRIAEGVKERFVLTPALRVSEQDRPEDEATAEEAASVDSNVIASPVGRLHADAAAQEPAVAAEKTVADESGAEQSAGGAGEARPEDDRYDEHRQTLEQRIAELEAALQQSPDEWEPDGSEVAGQPRPSMPSFEQQDSDEAADEAVDLLDESEVDVGEVSEPDQDAKAGAADLSETIDDQVPELFEAEAPETRDDETPDPEDGGKADLTDAEALLGPETDGQVTDTEEVADDWTDGEDAAEAVLLRDSDKVEESAEWQDENTRVFGRGEADKMSLRIDPDADDDIADDDVPLAFDAELSGGVEPDHDSSPDAFDMFAEDTVLDEAALREMVAQLVREELQGVLGERITRNVRRLVRREIQRAMSVHDLE